MQWQDSTVGLTVENKTKWKVRKEQTKGFRKKGAIWPAAIHSTLEVVKKKRLNGKAYHERERRHKSTAADELYR